MSKLDERLEKMGFQKIYNSSDNPKVFLYERKLSLITSLFIEGKVEKNHATYVYDFYKCRFYYHSKNQIIEATETKIYGKQLTSRVLISKVSNYITKFNLDDSR